MTGRIKRHRETLNPLAAQPRPAERHPSFWSIDRVKSSSVIISVAFGLALAGTAQAQHRGSEQDQLACTPDVYRLCSQFIPDEDDIVGCLKRNRPQLSAGCRVVFSRPDAAPKAAKPDDDD